MSTFLVDAFRSPDPRQTGRDVKVIDVLDKARAKLEQGFAGSQATKGALLDALGQTYKGLGTLRQSRDGACRGVQNPCIGARSGPPRHTHEPEQPRRRLRDAGRVSEAIALDEATLKLRMAKLGPDHIDTLKSRHNLALKYVDAGQASGGDRAFRVDAQTVRGEGGPASDTLTFMCRHNLANAYEAAGRLADGIALHEANVNLNESTLGPDHPDTLDARDSLAIAYERAGRHAEAIALHEVTLPLREQKIGARPPAHAFEPQQPGHRLRGSGPAQGSDPAPGGDSRASREEARARLTR